MAVHAQFKMAQSLCLTVCRYNLSMVKDGQWGGKEDDGSWNGLAGELQRKVNTRVALAKYPCYILDIYILTLSGKQFLFGDLWRW